MPQDPKKKSLNVDFLDFVKSDGTRESAALNNGLFELTMPPGSYRLEVGVRGEFLTSDSGSCTVVNYPFWAVSYYANGSDLWDRIPKRYTKVSQGVYSTTTSYCPAATPNYWLN